MMEICNKIYDIISSGDYSFIFRIIIIISALSMIIGVFRFVLHSSFGYYSSDDDAPESDNGNKVDLAKKNNMFTKYYDHYDQD